MKSITRRAFMKSSLGVGAGLLLPDSIFNDNLAYAADMKEELLKETSAKYIFNFSSPYITSLFKTTPHAHAEIKQLIEQYTQNKVYVKIHDAGRNGTGTQLSSSVKQGKKSQGALLSVSNLVPMVPEIDILNIPFWSANETEYLRLFKSQTWQKHILSKTRIDKIQVLFPYVVGSRTATSTKQYGKRIVAPQDFEGLKFRVPGSKSLKVFYELTHAKPYKFPWKTTAAAARKGRFEALDPSLVGLYSGPGNLKHELGVISEIESVHDGWVAIGSTSFIESMDSVTRAQFLASFNEIQTKQLALYHSSKQFVSQELIKLGTSIYTPTQQEKATLAQEFGHENIAWNPIKMELLGRSGLNIFDEFYKIAKG
jgi:TRAP-type C4-dicarboxylate transport system substrate-binding protein